LNKSMRAAWMAVGLIAVTALPARAQGRGHGPKQYTVTTDHAILVTRDVLVRQGYEVIRIEDKGPDRIVWYRAGNRGRGRGKGPPVKMVIHREADRVVFVDTPTSILVDIDLRLRLP
jgi:hypothetical protein